MSEKEDDRRPDSEALEEAKRIMKRLTEMPHKPHEPIGKSSAIASLPRSTCSISPTPHASNQRLSGLGR